MTRDRIAGSFQGGEGSSPGWQCWENQNWLNTLELDLELTTALSLFEAVLSFKSEESSTEHTQPPPPQPPPPPPKKCPDLRRRNRFVPVHSWFGTSENESKASHENIIGSKERALFKTSGFCL